MFLGCRSLQFTCGRVFGFLSLMTLASLAMASVNYPREFAAVAAGTRPKIDGDLAPGEWNDATRFDQFIDGDTLISSDEKGEFWLMYTAEAIYFAGRVTTDPRRIIADEYRDNVSLEANDHMRLLVDPFGQGNNFNSFGVNASSGTSIGLSGGRAAKTEWLGEIEARGRRTDTGWQFEMRIPWGIMAAPAGRIRDPKILINWYRTNKRNTYAVTPFNTRPEDVPVWRGIDIAAPVTPRTISLLPYAVAGASEGRDPIYNFGFDAKTALTDQLQFISTVAPDFRNIENSILSLDFSYFERLGSETRPFFQEGSGFLRAGNLFRSQRVRQIDFGTKVYGRLSPTDTIGAQVVSDFGERSVAVMGWERNLGSSEVNASAVANMERGRQNLAGTASWENRWGNHYPEVRFSFTDDQQRGSGWSADASYYYNRANTNYGFTLSATTPNFFPRAGFNPEVDRKGLVLSANKTWENLKGPVENIFSYANAYRFDRFDGGFYRDGVNMGVGVRLKSRIGLGANFSWDQFEANNDRSRSFDISFPSGDPYRNMYVVYNDSYLDGSTFRSWGLGGRYKPLQRMQLDASLQLVDFRGFDRQAIIGFRYDLDKAQSIGGRVVLRGDEWNGFATYRLGGRRGNEYFLIVGDPNSDKWRNRVAFKAVIPLTIRY